MSKISPPSSPRYKDHDDDARYHHQVTRVAFCASNQCSSSPTTIRKRRNKPRCISLGVSLKTSVNTSVLLLEFSSPFARNPTSHTHSAFQDEPENSSTPVTEYKGQHSAQNGVPAAADSAKTTATTNASTTVQISWKTAKN